MMAEISQFYNKFPLNDQSRGEFRAKSIDIFEKIVEKLISQTAQS